MLLAVYGTLKEGFGNHHLLEGSRYRGKIVTNPDYTMYSCWGSYPALKKGGDTCISCEIYAINKTTLKQADVLESHPSMYKRGAICTPYGHAWIYLFQGDTEGMPVIPSGIWTEGK